MLKHLDLFSGIGGFALACEWAGMETIGFVEIDKYCQKILRKHWPNVPIVEDIRGVEKIKQIATNTTKPEGSMDRGIICTSESRQPRRSSSSRNMGCQPRGEHRLGIGKQVEPQPAILITAGFPCQPFSVAGKQQGERDDRYLWPQTLAVIKAVKPKWILLENVAGIINLALDQVLSDMEGTDYSTETVVIPACSVNAWHRRDRVWIIAYSANSGSGQRVRDNGERQTINKGQDGFPQSEFREGSESLVNSEGGQSWEQTKPQGRKDTCRGSQEVITTDTQREGLERADTEGDSCRTGQSSEYGQREWQADWWTVEPELGRVAHGIPHRVDRLKCLGNAIVPQVAFEIIKVIMEIDSQEVMELGV